MLTGPWQPNKRLMRKAGNGLGREWLRRTGEDRGRSDESVTAHKISPKLTEHKRDT